MMLTLSDVGAITGRASNDQLPCEGVSRFFFNALRSPTANRLHSDHEADPDALNPGLAP